MTRSGAARLLLLVPPVAVGLWMLIAAGAEELDTYFLDYFVDAATGIVITLAGLVAWERRPAWRTGRLLVVAGYLWYVGSLYELAPVESLVPYLGFAFRGYYDLILAWVVLAVPRDRLTRRLDVGI